MCTLNRIRCTSQYTPSRRWVIGLLLTALVGGSCVMSWADGEVVGADFAITWMASPTPQVSEYRLYVSKTKGVYDRKSYLPVHAPATKASGAALKLTTDGQYYLTVTAAVPGGGESDASAEVPFVRQTSAAPVPPVAPVIADVTLPLVAIRAPVDGAEVPRNTTFPIEVDASDNVGITRLAITINGQPLCIPSILFAPPWRCEWKIPRAGGERYVINAQAIDQAGNNAQHQIEVVAK